MFFICTTEFYIQIKIKDQIDIAKNNSFVDSVHMQNSRMKTRHTYVSTYDLIEFYFNF